MNTKTRKVAITARLPLYIVEWMRTQDIPITYLIQAALKSYYKNELSPATQPAHPPYNKIVGKQPDITLQAYKDPYGALVPPRYNHNFAMWLRPRMDIRCIDAPQYAVDDWLAELPHSDVRYRVFVLGEPESGIPEIRDLPVWGGGMHSSTAFPYLDPEYTPDQPTPDVVDPDAEVDWSAVQMALDTKIAKRDVAPATQAQRKPVDVRTTPEFAEWFDCYCPDAMCLPTEANADAVDEYENYLRNK